MPSDWKTTFVVRDHADLFLLAKTASNAGLATTGMSVRISTVCPAIIQAEGGNTEMGNLSNVVQQLRREREQGEVQRIDAALAALGSISSNGAARPHTLAAC